MKYKTIKAILAVFAAFCFAFMPITSTFAVDQCSDAVCASSDYPDSIKAACGCSSVSSQQKTLPDVAINIINAVIGVSGLIAVIFIVIGGFQYMTSTGDATKIQKAKNTILYAVIGLVICALAFAIVNFAIANIVNP